MTMDEATVQYFVNSFDESLDRLKYRFEGSPERTTVLRAIKDRVTRELDQVLREEDARRLGRYV